jgi:hypothetical protein
MRRVAAAVVMIIAGCTAPDVAETSSETSELNGGASSPMAYRTWSPTLPVTFWIPHVRNMTAVVYTVPRTSETFAWGVGDGVNVGWVYKMTVGQRDAFVEQMIDGFQTIALPGSDASWVVVGAHGGNPPSPTPGTTEFSIATVNRIVRTVGTTLDAQDATKNFGGP